MKNLIYLLIIVAFLYSCDSKDEGIKITKDSPQYEFAKSLAKKLPSVDPDSNKILVSTNRFNITTGSVIEALYFNFNTRLDKLIELNKVRLKNIFNDNAKLLGEKNMLIDAAGEAGIDISNAEIDSMIQTEYEKAGGKEKYLEHLEKNGITIEYLREDFSNTLAIQKFLVSAVKNVIKIPEEEIQQKLLNIKSISVRHILLKTNDKNGSNNVHIRKKMEKILELAKSGSDFAELARKYTDDTGSKKNGGLYKNIERGDMVQPFEDIAFSVPLGEISEIFETEFGYHILKVIDRKKESRSALEIEKELREQKQDKEIPLYIKKLKKEYEFTIIGL